MATLTLSLSPAAEAKLRERAAVDGQPLDAYVSRVLERAATALTVDEILAPVRRQVAESGVSDADLDAFLDDLRDEAYRDRHRRAP